MPYFCLKDVKRLTPIMLLVLKDKAKLKCFVLTSNSKRRVTILPRYKQLHILDIRLRQFRFSLSRLKSQTIDSDKLV